MSLTLSTLRKLLEVADLPLDDLLRVLRFSLDKAKSQDDLNADWDTWFYAMDGAKIAQAVIAYVKGNGWTSELHSLVLEFRLLDLSDDYNHHWRNARRELEKLAIDSGIDLIVPVETWAETMIADLQLLDEPLRGSWDRLLAHAFSADMAKPTMKWRKRARELREALSDYEFLSRIRRWFPLLAQQPKAPMRESNYDMLKGLVWLTIDIDNPEIAPLVGDVGMASYKKVPGIGPRSVKLGNACIYTLGEMPGIDAVAQLAKIQRSTSYSNAQSMIDRTLEKSAARHGMTRGDLEEIAVPSLGLDSNGEVEIAIGDITAKMHLVDAATVELIWIRSDGKAIKSVPKQVRESHREELDQVNRSRKEIRAMLVAQRDRLERMLLEPRSWPLETWHERYLEHPLLKLIGGRLIWWFSDSKEQRSGIWHNGQIVDAHGEPLDVHPDETSVRLWHPIEEDADTILAWRTWLESKEIVQPFKQAFREIYRLTDAERTTGTYSNRFAGHILKQHQFNALCTARGWGYGFQGAFDSSNTPVRNLPGSDLRMEFWVEPAILDEVSPSQIYLYISTDQVRFCRGMQAVPLEQVPPLLFSEGMRDVDLFVGVASVGNDPEWRDGGFGERYDTYWSHYAFGELMQSARTRRDVLERLLPRLKIAERCSLDDRFLNVRGELRSYRIHLGSGNILMSPNDQYLCIVADRSSGSAAGSLYLPFEGDNTLSVILSKAFLLADDSRITDPTIIRQIEDR